MLSKEEAAVRKKATQVACGKKIVLNTWFSKRSWEHVSSYFAPFPITVWYCPDCCRSSDQMSFVSELIFCQNHFRLMTVVFVYPLSTLPGCVHCFPPLPLNSCQQVYRAAPLLCICQREPKNAMGMVCKGVTRDLRSLACISSLVGSYLIVFIPIWVDKIWKEVNF